MQITPAQCKAARALIDMDQASLAKASNVSRNTIVSFETGQREPGANNIAAIRSALESAGVEFTNGGQPGVRLSRKPRHQTGEPSDSGAIAIEHIKLENESWEREEPISEPKEK
jgi:transcriptional regulator with XRE-family HTH domain